MTGKGTLRFSLIKQVTQKLQGVSQKFVDTHPIPETK